MIIVEIVRDATKVPANDPLRFRIGSAVVEGGMVVEKIIYNKYAYNNGYQGDFPAYTVSFVGSDDRRIIRADTVIDLQVLTEPTDKKKKNQPITDAVVELPD